MSDEKKLSRAELFLKKHEQQVEFVEFTTSDGFEWEMQKPSSKFFFDLFLNKDLSIGALQVEDGEDADETKKVQKQQEKLIPIYEFMRDTIMRFSHSPKVVDAGKVADPAADEISIDDFPSFEYMTEVFNKLVQAAGVPLNELQKHETFRQ
jgi:hypothetical protein